MMKFLHIAYAGFLLSLSVASYALAQNMTPIPSVSIPAAPPPFVDLTGLAITLSGAALTILGAVATALVNKYVKDAAARATIDAAISDSIGVLQQASQGEIKTLDPHLVVPAGYANYAPAIQHVVDHAGDAMERMGISTTMVAERIEARLGLANVAHNLAVTSNPTPAVAPPLAAVQGPGR